MKLRRVGQALTAGLIMLGLTGWAIGHIPSATAPAPAILSGRVLYQGPLPVDQSVPVHKHRELCGEERPLGRYRVSATGEVESAVVLLEGEALPKGSPEQVVAILDNRGCEFLPRVQVAQPLATLEVRNSDPILDVGHTWMRAYILISSSPFSAVTGGEGTFEIRGIPPGWYRLLAWHEAFGTIERELTVTEGEHSSLTLVFGSGTEKRG